MVNTTTTTTTIIPIIDERDEILAYWEICVLSIILVVTLIGNLLVLFSLWLRRYRGKRRKLTRMYYFMMHLSIADLITGVFNVLPQLVWDITYRFQGGYGLCKIVKFMQPLGNYLSSYVLTATAIDRYHAICYPMSYCLTTSRQSRIMVHSAWCFSLFLCIPQVFVFSYREISTGIWDCWAEFYLPYSQQIYVTWFSIAVFLLPFMVLVFTYVSICIGIWGNSEISKFKKRDELTRMDSNNNNNNNNNREPLITRAKIKTVKQMITVVCLYVITSSPFIGCQLWATWDPNAPQTPFFTGPIFAILVLLSSLTSSVNPWIYLGFNKELRIIIKKFIFRNSENQNENEFLSSTRSSTIIGSTTRYNTTTKYQANKSSSAAAHRNNHSAVVVIQTKS
ncbi:hypothetical protein HCN44_008897 [Aphidius gifuensis]|uniref:G-protein coupled receptors family 1 profile domain-containing protein n=1 Tax=Aphidius gifuensis TaxID=684658 RepID=A0A834XRL3_APHGI|nr:isotocin receptor-like [Aphidius gifuensis]KAF7991526.1 hypothetical protein HCN44_008897 [Aphidius gifuensis]